MRNGILKGLNRLMVVCAIGLTAALVLSCGGSSGGSDDGDANNPPQTYSASGTYIYNADVGTLVMTFTSSDFGDCGPDVGVENHTVDSLLATTMILNEGEDNEIAFTRDSGTAGDILGKWVFTDDDGNTYNATFNNDLSVVVDGEIVVCDDGDNGGSNNTPETYTASANYFYNSDTGMLVMTFIVSDFPSGCGPEVGDQIVNVDSITATTMYWVDDDITWTRDSGTADDILGVWDWVDDSGNAYEATFDDGFELTVVGEIVDCN